MSNKVPIMEMGEHKKIDLEKLELWRDGNVRKSDVYVDIEDLAKNIHENGLLMPLIVKEDVPDIKYLVISGQRRLQACRMINYSPVPCIVVKEISADEAKVLSLSENLYRRDMSEDDISDACDYLYKKLGKVLEVARRLGVSERKVRKYLGYKNVPEELKGLVREKKITSSQAILIYTQFPELERQIEVAKELASITERMDKSKFFQAVKESLPTDDLPKIRERAKRLAAMKTYEILLPPKTSHAIEKEAVEMGVEPEHIIAQILEYWIEERVSKGLPLIV